MDSDDVARLADRLVGTSGRWETLGDGGGANVVLRRDGLIAKWHFREEAHHREVAAMSHISARLPGLVPSLVAAGDGVIVMEDVGDGPTLADELIGGDAQTAVLAVLEWTDALARLHEAMWLGPDDEVLHAGHVILFGLMHQAIEAEERLTNSGRWSAAGSEWERLTSLAQTVGPTTLSIGDMCPGNQMWTPQGLRFFDLEAAGHFNPALDVSYLITPWSSCWCTWDLPAELRNRAVEQYLGAVSRSTDVRASLVDAVVLWAVGTAAFMFGDIDEADRPMREHPHTPQRRSVIVTRLDRAIRYPDAGSRYPHTVEWLEETLGALLSAWGEVDPLPVAPALR